MASRSFGDFTDGLDVPPVGREPLGGVVAQRQLGRPVDGDVVVVVDADQPAESRMPGQRRGLVADALGQVAVAGTHEGAVVHTSAPNRARSERSVIAMPTALAKPWPSGPVVTSTPAVWRASG